jgi:deoxyadenosine/deoxycytidine kinase
MSSFNMSSSPVKRTVIISVEGNIGAGKSTLLKYLTTYAEEILEYRRMNAKKMKILQEPVDIWNTVMDENGKNILTKYYEDPDKYSFPFQILAYTTRLSLITDELEKKDSDIIICERSLGADKNIFAKMLYDDKKIEFINYQIYNRLYSDTAVAAHAIIYLDTSPEVCMERINKRSRTGEDKIQLEYLEKCKKYYDDWISNEDRNHTHVLHLNTNEDIDYTDENLIKNNANIRKIIDFIEYVEGVESMYE